MDYRQLLPFALGRKKAPLVLKDARLVNVLSGEIYPADIAVSRDVIVGIGSYTGQKEVNLEGRYVYPGLIDGHVHLESSMVSPEEYAAAVLPRGTTTVIADPHEIANVWGTDGIDYMLAASEGLPLNVFFTLPSCVPATDMEDSGARLEAKDLLPYFSHPRVLGLAELMNVPGVLEGDEKVWAKIKLAKDYGKLIDGHAPGFTGKELAAYKLAGIASDHECVDPDEARERLRLGMQLMLREGSASKNLLDLLAVVNDNNACHCSLVSDDRHPHDLLAEGHLDHMLRMAVSKGIRPVTALGMATINTARYFSLHNYGALAPGYRADLVVANDLENFEPHAVYSGGKMVAYKGELTGPLVAKRKMAFNQPGFKMRAIAPRQLKIASGGSEKALVIGLIPHQIVTEKIVMEPPVVGGYFEADPVQDIVKLAVAERHHATGTIGLGLLHGFGLREGALASSVAHDSHNLVVVGVSDEDMLVAAEAVAGLGGGLAVVSGGKTLGTLPLPIGGLMTPKPVSVVNKALQHLNALARKLGVKREHDPFMTLSFLSLPVIPELKLTNRGLFDVQQWKIVSVSATDI